MTIARKRPDPRKRVKARKWDYASPKNGKTLNGFLAGYPTWVECHHYGNDLPCRAAVTDGKLDCRLCGALGPPTWRGFTPYYDTEYQRCFTIVTEDYMEAVEEIPAHAMIELSRASRRTSPVVIRPKLWRTTPIPPAADRVFPVDLTHFLFGILWKDAELQSLLVASAVPASVSPVSLPADPPSKAMTPEPDAAYAATMRRMRANAAKLPGKLDTAGIGDLPPGSPGRNGKHKPE